MLFKLSISKEENLFFFISNLSQWHFSCRPDYNAEWIKMIGPLSNREKTALSGYRVVISKYGFNYKNEKPLNLGARFYVPIESKKWAELKKAVTKEEYVKIKAAIDIFRPKFNRVWDQVRIKKWGSALNKMLRSKNFSKRLPSDIHRFLGVTRTKQITVHLFAAPSTNRTAAGGANLGHDDLTLEVPIYKLNNWNVEFAIAILFHEMTHTAIDGSSIRKWIDREFLKNKKGAVNLPSGRGLQEIIRELVAESVAPYGYYFNKYGKAYTPVPDMLLSSFAQNKKGFWRSDKYKTLQFRNLMKYLVWKTYPLCAYYDAANMKLDKDFIKELFTFFADEKRGA
jgi:hypothetical protein